MKLPKMPAKTSKKIAVFYMAHDGITSHYAGIGTYTKSYLDNFPKIIGLLKKGRLYIDLYLITPKYNKSFYGYNENIKQRNKSLAKKYGGKLIEVDNGMNGLDSYGEIKNWNLCAANATKSIKNYFPKYEKNIVIAVDTPFLRVGEFLNKSCSKKNFSVVLSPQSTEQIHHSGIFGRYKWEKKVFDYANRSKNVFVSFSSQYIKHHLIKEYRVNIDRLIPSMSGLSLGSERYKKFTQGYIASRLQEYDIPIDRQIVFTVGRIEKYKGFEETIKLFLQINKKIDPYLVMVGVSYIDNNPLIKKLVHAKTKNKIEGKFIFNLDLVLPTLLWQWKNTKISCHLSQFEPFGLAPTEARLLAKNNGPVVIVSDRGGLKEQIINSKDGFIASYGSIESYKTITDKIFKMSSMDLKKIRILAYGRVVERYNSFKNILTLLGCLDRDIKLLIENKKRRNPQTSSSVRSKC